MLHSCHFWEFEPPYMGAQKNFFLRKFSKNKAECDFNQVFRFSTLEMCLSNLALFENAQNVRDKI